MPYRSSSYQSRYRSSVSRKKPRRPQWHLNDYWLFNRDDLPLKIWLMVLVILMMTTGLLTFSVLQAHATRDTAYQRILNASVDRDYLGMVTGAEDFLSNLAHLPLLEKDHREAQVRTLYDEAFVRWFVQQTSQLDSTSLAHVQRYRTLSANQ